MRCVNKPSLAFNSRDLNAFYEIYFKNEIEKMIEEGKLYKRGHQYRKYSENSKAALMRKMRDAVMDLSETPNLYMKIEKKDRNKREFRRMVIDNFVVLYTVDEKKKKVYIAHMHYGRRNYL